MNPFSRPFTLGGGSILPQTVALIDRMSSTPSRRRQAAINRAVSRLIEADIWQNPRFNGLYVLAAHDLQAARLNWFDATSAVVQGAPIFTADRGLTGVEADAGYLRGVNFTGLVGNSHLGVWRESGEVRLGPGNVHSQLVVSADRAGFNFGQRGLSSPTGNFRHVVASWPAELKMRLYRNGSLDRSNDLPNWGGIFTTNTAATMQATHETGGVFEFSTGRLAAVHYGKAVTDLEVARLYAALNPYMIEVGAAA